MTDKNEELLETTVFPIIGLAGESKSIAYEALKLAKNGMFEEAEERLKESNELILKAHELQTELITKEADGEGIDVGVIFVHAQDHLMCTMSEKNMIKEMIDILKIVYQKK